MDGPALALALGSGQPGKLIFLMSGRSPGRWQTKEKKDRSRSRPTSSDKRQHLGGASSNTRSRSPYAHRRPPKGVSQNAGRREMK
ncbi:hypothetical protein BC826DRAFT_989570 [Russula brevipes]|nr:hypothetical protein BC826DRAFT_989570 [Russula brevipes]